VDAAMIIFLAYSLANIMLMSATPDSNLIRFYDRVVIPFCLYWLIRILTPSVKDLRRFAPLAVGIIWVQFAIGLAQWFLPQILPNAWLSRLGERTTGSFGNPGTFTITMIFSALVLIQYAVSANTKRQRVIPFISIGIAFFSVFLSFSRGSWLGALLVIFGLVYLYPRVLSKLFFAAVMVGTIVLLVFLSSFAEFAMERLETQSTVAGRLIGGAATMQLIRLKPALGWGYGNHDLYDEQFRGRVLDFAVNNEHSSHNTYLLIASEMGLIGLALYLFPAVYLLVRSFKLRKQMAPGGYMGRTHMIMLWLLLGDIFIIANFTDLFQSYLFSSGVWWVTLGLIATIVTRTEKRAAVQIYPLNP
jgi:O-antigen ligase